MAGLARLDRSGSGGIGKKLSVQEIARRPWYEKLPSVRNAASGVVGRSLALPLLLAAPAAASAPLPLVAGAAAVAVRRNICEDMNTNDLDTGEESKS